MSKETTALTGRENFITHLAETIGSRANAAAVFGEPIVRGNTTVVPVAQARWGLGGGGGRDGSGGGGGMVVKPVGYLVMRDSEVEYYEIQRPLRILTAVIAGMLLATIL